MFNGFPEVSLVRFFNELHSKTNENAMKLIVSGGSRKMLDGYITA